MQAASVERGCIPSSDGRDLGCRRQSRANLSSKGYQKSVPQSCGIIVATGCNTNFPLYGTGCEGLNDKRLGYNFQLSLLLIGCSIPLEVVSGKEVKAKNNSCKEGLFCLSNRRIRDPYVRWCERCIRQQSAGGPPTRLPFRRVP